MNPSLLDEELNQGVLPDGELQGGIGCQNLSEIEEIQKFQEGAFLIFPVLVQVDQAQVPE